MIIQCINCNKKFEVNSSLIPLKGREIQCGSCNHTWFYKFNEVTTPTNLTENSSEKKTTQKNILEKSSITRDDQEDLTKNEIIINDDNNKFVEFTDKIQIKKKSSFNIGKVLSYFVVSIITFISLIIILDTFETSLITKIPNLELILYNFFETIKDIFLFIKDLFL